MDDFVYFFFFFFIYKLFGIFIGGTLEHSYIKVLSQPLMNTNPLYINYHEIFIMVYCCCRDCVNNPLVGETDAGQVLYLTNKFKEKEELETIVAQYLRLEGILAKSHLDLYKLL